MGITKNLADAESSLDSPTFDPGTLGERVCTNTALRLAARRLGQLYDEALAPVNLKSTQVGLMVKIHSLMGADQQGPTLQDLATRLAIQLSALTHALRPLVRDGIVELRQDAQDRRTKRGVLTPLGKARLSEAMVLWAAANDRVEAVLGPASAASLRALADQVASDAFLAAYKSEIDHLPGS
ncbi:MarR family winged helix-turn-helix transcriptional regulator [Ramlibacter sp. WS9]|uniref:MarR family winged helix-turn-helix transcriptional regulator n=1 Tax=Ramlibacter sp. WS9 TaxID=1882741 RepID=UPI001144A367|nr:MarR family transcriptional regulator [Ramlibacter sp. WS9]ROZ79893.1 MarR family transcriptional regulator [Ramlibacter sp. WS9]